LQIWQIKISKLRLAIRELETEILPSLQKIEAIARAEHVESFPTEFAQEKPIVKAGALVEGLKVREDVRDKT